MIIAKIDSNIIQMNNYCIFQLPTNCKLTIIIAFHGTLLQAILQKKTDNVKNLIDDTDEPIYRTMKHKSRTQAVR